MSKTGFVTRLEATAAKTSSRGGRRATSKLAAIRAMGSAAAADMNPDAINPNLQPKLSSNCKVYVVGPFPGVASDRRGKHFQGRAGEILRGAIPSWARGNVSYDYMVRTRPAGGELKAEEIEAFRSDVEKDIAESKPEVVIGLGKDVMSWAIDQKKSYLKAVRGKWFPIEVNGHTCWFIPTLDPSALAIMESGPGIEDKVPFKQWQRAFSADIEQAFEDDLPVPKIHTEDLSGVVHCLTVAEVKKAVKFLLSCDEIGWDWETNNLRPYTAGAKILSVAFSDGETTFCIPIDHPESPWTKADREIILDYIMTILLEGPRVIAHNLPFELEWALEYFGDEVLDGRYGCSLQAAYIVDPGPPGDAGSGGHSLDLLCRNRFGLALKSLTPAASMVARLEQVSLEKVLDYNALDAKWCLQLWWRLMVDVEKHDLVEGYQRQMRRIPSIVSTQNVGVPIDQRVTREFSEQFALDLDRLEKEILADETVQDFMVDEKFNIKSGAHIGKLIKFAGLQKEVPTTKKGAIATDAKSLEIVSDRLPVLEKIIEYRTIDKQKGTYVDRFLEEDEKSYTYPDGKIHCHFAINKTRSGRLSSEHPNNQNWPKRKNVEVRRQLVAPKGHLFLAADQGQIEARVLAMASKDKNWIEMIWDDYDIHGEYAQKLIDMSPQLEKRFGNFKGVRSAVKNGWVFPAFYGSSPKSIIYNLDLPETAALDLFDEFWQTFSGIADWQDDTWGHYLRTGEVRSLTGRRRLYPLSRNMVVNSGIQGAASDINQDACDRLYAQARREDKPWLQSVMVIHDDITFIVPEDKMDEAVEDIVSAQLGFEAPWVNVPLSVEVEVGPNLCDMKSIGTWTNKDGDYELTD